MGTVNIVKTIKQIHPGCIVMVKIGTFYNVYSKDAYILSYLLKYKIIEKENIPACSFPLSSISKVENILEKNKINYLVVDKRSNYEEEYKMIDKQVNNYDKIFEIANLNVKKMFRIQKIYNELVKKINITNIENILDKIEMELKGI